jgi:hypothetical protein
MTSKADFTPEEWQVVIEGPPAAGIAVATASGGGTFRESFALAKAYTEVRKEQGESELLDAIVSERPKIKHERANSAGELKDESLQQLRDALALLDAKATPGEVEDYRKFVLSVANRVAHAHKENGQEVSPAEQATIDEISATLGAQT